MLIYRREKRFHEIKQFSQSHTVRKWQTPMCLIPNLLALFYPVHLPIAQKASVAGSKRVRQGLEMRTEI